VIVVGATSCPWKADAGEDLHWLFAADEMLADRPDLLFFLALEVDARGDEPHRRVLERLASLPSRVWRFMVDDGSDEIGTENRLIRICTGRNLVREFGQREGAEAVLYLDVDLRVPGDCVSRLLEVDAPLVGGRVPAYAHLTGPMVSEDPPVRRHMNTAGFLLAKGDAYRRMVWSWDKGARGTSLGDPGLTDDFATQRDAHELGFGPTLVRQDVVGAHRGQLLRVEDRRADRAYRRAEPLPPPGRSPTPEPPPPAMPTVAAVPTVRRVDTLVPLVAQLCRDETVTEVMVMDNGHPEEHRSRLRAMEELDPRVRVVDTRGLGLYAQWNLAIDHAAGLGRPAANVVLLNDDAHAGPHLCRDLCAALRADEWVWVTYPDPSLAGRARGPGGDRLLETSRWGGRVRYTTSTEGFGGMAGWCFALKAEARTHGGLPPVDERFEWWCGDDDLAFAVAERGFRQAAAVGVPAWQEGEGTARLPGFEWTEGAKQRDVKLLVEKWGRRR
jgi:GT2 family glycosyltransferase